MRKKKKLSLKLQNDAKLAKFSVSPDIKYFILNPFEMKNENYRNSH